eukprot:gb/GEZN01014195.1/.p1 GENE.gb/GEZN01014195.1/~~gb/GEZN01014195.1/.p1  ORF type:complete len:165 (-),score=34.32 gb/GEZN01014195.1/:473-910(-)
MCDELIRRMLGPLIEWKALSDEEMQKLEEKEKERAPHELGGMTKQVGDTDVPSATEVESLRAEIKRLKAEIKRLKAVVSMRQQKDVDISSESSAAAVTHPVLTSPPIVSISTDHLQVCSVFVPTGAGIVWKGMQCKACKQLKKDH